MEYYGNNDFRTYHLAHHGIKGMKWGVRRYRNYDGSYTKKGLERYRNAESQYQKAAEKTKEAKEAYKTGTGSKSALKAAKGEQKLARRKLNKSYDSLKIDKRADQGKELYRRGKTITGNAEKAVYAQMGIMTVSAIVGAVADRGRMAIITKKYGEIPLSKIAPAVIMAGGTAINLSLAAKNQYEAKRLRAYYSH